MNAEEKFHSHLIEKYHVVETTFFPAKWKVEGINWPKNNEPFFIDKEKAQKEVDRRNKQEGF